MYQPSDLLIGLVASAVTGKPLPDAMRSAVTEEMLDEIYRLSKGQDLTHLVSQGITVNRLTACGGELGKKWDRAKLMAVMRYERMQYEIDRLFDALEQNQIPFIPLKGAEMRRYYPEAWMRTSCDVDILILPQDQDRAVAALCDRLQYRVASTGTYDLSLFSPTGIHLELHFALMEKRFAAGAYLQRIWEYASPVCQGGFRFAMTDDLFYFHQLVHLAKHFVSGGCGIRLFLDIWLLNRHADFHKTHQCDAYLEDVGLLTFEKAVCFLARVWFEGERHTELSLQMEQFVLGSGIYGSVSNNVAIQQSQGKKKSAYIWARIWVPHQQLYEYYPFLKTKKYLIPWYQCKRWFKLFSRRTLKRSVQEFSVIHTTDKEWGDRVGSMMHRLDLH